VWRGNLCAKFQDDFLPGIACAVSLMVWAVPFLFGVGAPKKDPGLSDTGRGQVGQSGD
jgi:hypothetical protein